MRVVSLCGPGEQIESPVKEGQEHQKTVVKCEGSFNAEEFEGMESEALPLVKSEPLGFFVEMGDFVKEEPYKHQEAKIECMKDLNEGGRSATVQSEPQGTLEQVEAFFKEEPEELQEIKTECEEFYEAEQSEVAWGESLPDVKAEKEDWLLMKGKREAVEMMSGNGEILQQSFSQMLNEVEDGRNQASSRGDPAESEEFSSGCFSTSKNKVETPQERKRRLGRERKRRARAALSQQQREEIRQQRRHLYTTYSQEQIDTIRNQSRERMKAQREQETEEKRIQRRENMRQRTQQRIEQESSEAREVRREKMRLRMRQRIEEESEEERLFRRENMRRRMALYRQNEIVQQRNDRLNMNRNAMRNERAQRHLT